MQREIFSCCKDSIHNTPWIFIYNNSEIYSICETHFTSIAHRNLVKYVINTKTPSQVFLPEDIFKEILIEAVQ